MRLERLDVGGFGRIGELRVDFSPGITVVLGANESGKSTVHRAVRAALYGIDAGGQGRAAARSDWARWRPWQGDRFGVALTYALADGRRFRVARRLESREERVQVQELGGRDVTDALRQGRSCVPGLHHLGIDEAVFCASAWIGEDGLLAGAVDCPGARAEHIQEAIERLADSASRATAGEALARLRTAMDRVGTEARKGSALGAATQRLRRLDEEVARARQRLAAIAAEQERLRELEAAASVAEARRTSAERAWITGRLAQIAAHRFELADALGEATRLEEAVAGWRGFASFPLEREERVTQLGAELRLASDAEALATARWDEARGRTRALERRRLEISTSVHALAGAPHVGDTDRAEAARLTAELAAEAGVERRIVAVEAAASRLGGLRREIAAMGMGSVPPGSADAVAALVSEAGRGAGARHLRPLAGAVATLGLLLGAGGAAAHVVVAGAAAAAVCLVAALAALVAERLGGGPAAAARRRLARMCPGLDVGTAGLLRIAERLPRLRALHEDLRRQEGIADAGRAELEEASARLEALVQRCLVLAARLPIEVGEPPVPAVGPRGHLARAGQALAAVAAAAEAGARRSELEVEDAGMAAELLGLTAVGDEAERTARHRADLAAEMRRLCDVPGLAAEDDPGRAVAGFRQAAATRRQLEAARVRLGEVRRRINALGPPDDGALERQAAQLADELLRRGGDPAAVPAELPLEPGRLHALELAAERARQDAERATTDATAMGERLAGLLDGLPPLSDLEDERAACLVVRDRCLHQLEALRRAATLIEEAARRVHRDVAPRLAASVGERLALLTEGRYDEVDVDAERFAVSLRSPDRLELVGVELLSRGTRDQVALLLRLALAGVFGEGGEPVPLLLDDPLQSSDPMRRSTAIAFLARLAEHTQIVVTTTDPRVAEELAAEAVTPCTVVTMSRRTATVAAGARAAAATAP